MSQHLDDLYEIRRRLVARRRELAGWAIDDTVIDQGEAYGEQKKYNHDICLRNIIEIQEKIEIIDRIISEEQRP